MSAMTTLSVGAMTIVVALVVTELVKFLTSGLHALPGPKSPWTLKGIVFGNFPEILSKPPIIPHLEWAKEFGMGAHMWAPPSSHPRA
jgi:hypothetical protein